MFKIRSCDDGRVPCVEYLPCGAIRPSVGLALIQTDGLLAKASGSSAPLYISVYDSDAALAAGTPIPVIRVNGDTVFETENSADFSSVKLGNKVTLHSDGLRVTATTASGVAEVVGIGGTAAGSKILVRFPD